MSHADNAAKLVLAGPVAAGKTTAITSITDGEPISTDMPMSEGSIEGKTTTTVALDYSAVKLDDDTELLVYGLPGQAHFSFMRPIILNGAFGVIIMLDGRQETLETDCANWLQVVAEFAPDAAVAIGVTHTDLMPSFSISELRRVTKDAPKPIPIFTFDARDRQQTLQVVRALILLID